MVRTHLSRRWGGAGADPNLDEMRSALKELDVEDPEHPDCWLSDESGWTIGAFGSGKVILENVESGEGPWHLPQVDRDTAVQLWLALQRGDLSWVRGHAWQDGYGA